MRVAVGGMSGVGAGEHLIRRLVFVVGAVILLTEVRHERSSSPKLLRPRLNSAAQNFTVVNDGAESNSFLMSI